MSFPQWVREKRKALNLTMSECAKRAGVSQPVWSEYENAERDLPRKATVVKIATALGADPREALGMAGYLSLEYQAVDEQLARRVGDLLRKVPQEKRQDYEDKVFKILELFIETAYWERCNG